MIGIMTLHPKMYNYGGFLQEMALQDYLIDNGHKCEIINYIPEMDVNSFSIKRDLRNLSISKIQQKMVSRYCQQSKKTVNKNDQKERKEAFDTCRRKKLILSKPITKAELYDNFDRYDSIICGSDQIWNPDYNIPAFFLDFAPKTVNTISYAASIGKNRLSKREKAVYKKLLTNLNYISVREQSSVELLQPLSENNIDLVLDPTLLHERDYWEKQAAESNCVYSNYIFCYLLNPDNKKIENIKKVSKKLKYNVAIITSLTEYEEDESYANIKINNANPCDFVNLIRNAEMIITDSFHATVFSLIFGKKFWTFGRNANGYNMNTRIENLLNIYDATEYFGSDINLDSRSYKDLKGYNEEKAKLYIEKSIRFLENALKEN